MSCEKGAGGRPFFLFCHIMDSLILFFLCLWLIKSACQKKRIGWENFIDVRWKNQPKLFLLAVFVLCVTAFDSFCHIISIGIFTEHLDLIDSVFCFVVSFGALIVCVFENKNIIWKEHPFIGCVFVVSLFYLSLISLKKIFY